MSLKRRQSGQALVGVLVVMILIFLLAGAVSVGAAALLARLQGAGNAFTDDFAAQSAVAAAASFAAAHPSGCPAAPSGLSSSFTVPHPPPGRPQPGLCTSLSGVPPTPFSSFNLSAWSSDGCSVTDLSPFKSAQITLWIFFNARWRGSAFAYVDNVNLPTGSTSAPGCPQAMPSGKLPCSARPTPEAFPVALSCTLAERPFLFVRNAARQPQQAFYLQPASQDNDGTLYVTAAGTGRGPGKDYEGAVLYRTGRGALQLRYEAPLP